MVMSVLPVQCFANESDTRIRLGYYDLEEFLIGASEDEPKSGFAYELFCEIATVNGWEYEFIYGDFSDLLAKLYAGEIDLLPCVVYSDERAETLLFSDDYINEERYFVSALTEEARNLHNIDASILNGKRVSTVRDAFQNVIFEKWAADNNISYEFVYSDSFPGSWEALQQGEADFVLNIDNSAPTSGFTTLFEIGASHAHFAAAPGRQDIIDGIDSAVDTIKQINPFAISHLQEKYLFGALSSYQLSEGEKAWVDEHPVIRVAALTNDIPYSYYADDGSVTGVFPEMFSMMLDGLSVDSSAEWVLFDSIDQMRRELNAGSVDLICPYYHDHYLAQTDDLIISEYITRIPMGILTMPKVSSSADNVVATPGTRLGVNYVNEYYPDTETKLYDSVAECIEAVRTGEASAAIAHSSALQESGRKYQDDILIQVLKNSCEVCFSTLPENNDLICLLNRGLHLISNATIEGLEFAYTPVDNSVSFRQFVHDHMFAISASVAALMLLVGFLFERIAASRKLKEARDMANEANNAKTVFLFNMSHDIRTPMNAIIGYTAMARKYCTGQPQLEDYLSKIDIAGNNLLSIVNQVLEMSRIEAGKVELESDLVNLIDNFSVQKAIVESNAAVNGITLKCEIGELQDRCVKTDVGRLNQVITNILGNAIKYTKEGGSVTYSLRQTGKDGDDIGLYEFKVTDTGIGMSKEFVDHIFDQFSRERTSTVSGIQGTGLGMSIVKKIVTMMGGDIRVESELGKGTAVTVELPLEIDHSCSSCCTEETTELPDFSGMHVLLVEDNEMNREIASELLSDYGITVDEAENGKIAVQKLSASAHGTYDFVLMDVQMPVMDGYEATVAIRKLDDPVHANIPIIALSANAFEEDRQKSMAVGMNDHVAKPIDVNVLFRTIAKYI